MLSSPGLQGMAGGELVIVPPAASSFDASEASIVGNTCLYGATGGRMFANGRAGERFAVRNSRAEAVVEGAGDHCCEWRARQRWRGTTMPPSPPPASGHPQPALPVPPPLPSHPAPHPATPCAATKAPSPFPCDRRLTPPPPTHTCHLQAST
jgi:hypothetical protein